MKNLPTIPKEEFKQRRDNLRDLMISNQIDIIIAYSDDRAHLDNNFLDIILIINHILNQHV